MQLTYFRSKNYYRQSLLFIMFNSLKSIALFYKAKFLCGNKMCLFKNSCSI